MAVEMPNPGSFTALYLGCTCPVANNNGGWFAPPDGWVVTEACPVHDRGEPRLGAET